MFSTRLSNLTGFKIVINVQCASAWLRVSKLFSPASLAQFGGTIKTASELQETKVYSLSCLCSSLPSFPSVVPAPLVPLSLSPNRPTSPESGSESFRIYKALMPLTTTFYFLPAFYWQTPKGRASKQMVSGRSISCLSLIMALRNLFLNIVPPFSHQYNQMLANMSLLVTWRTKVHSVI